jgi:hypothetical protein
MEIPSHIAAALLLMTSSRASCVSGRTLVVDGGVPCKLPHPALRI